MESELFGHERGAFSGAVAQRKGKFEAAQGERSSSTRSGTSGPKQQLDLLRVLETHTIVRVGGNQADSGGRPDRGGHEPGSEQGGRRPGSSARTCSIGSTSFPSRCRRCASARRTSRCWSSTCWSGCAPKPQRPCSRVTEEAMGRCMAHDWPGNVRELRNVLERGSVVTPGPVVGCGCPGPGGGGGLRRGRAGHCSRWKPVEREHIAEVLRYHNGNVSQSARVLGIDRVTLYSKIRKYGPSPRARKPRAGRDGRREQPGDVTLSRRCAPPFPAQDPTVFA